MAKLAGPTHSQSTHLGRLYARCVARGAALALLLEGGHAAFERARQPKLRLVVVAGEDRSMSAWCEAGRDLENEARLLLDRLVQAGLL